MFKIIANSAGYEKPGKTFLFRFFCKGKPGNVGLVQCRAAKHLGTCCLIRTEILILPFYQEILV